MKQIALKFIARLFHQQAKPPFEHIRSELLPLKQLK